MKIVADYKRRKELKEYLPHDEHWKLKSDRRSVEKQPTPTSAVLSPLNPNSEAEAGDAAAKLEAKLTTQTSEEAKKRAIEEENGMEGSPPSKKCNVENGENQEVISEVAAIENGAA